MPGLALLPAMKTQQIVLKWVPALGQVRQESGSQFRLVFPYELRKGWDSEEMYSMANHILKFLFNFYSSAEINIF